MTARDNSIRMYDEDIARALCGIKDVLHALVEAMKLKTEINVNGIKLDDEIDERMNNLVEKIIKKERMNGEI